MVKKAGSSYQNMKPVLILLVITALADSVKIDELRKLFNDQQSRVYLFQGDSSDIDGVAKKIYRQFLNGTSFAQQNRLDDYFKQWTEVGSIQGPFTSAKEQNEGMKSLENSKHFHSELMFESMIDNRDDVTTVKPILKTVLFSKETKIVKMYFTGDDDIIQGLVILSKYNDGSVCVVTFISD